MLSFKETLLLFLTTAFLGVLLFRVGSICYEVDVLQSEVATISSASALQKKVRMMFVGDIMLDRGVESSVQEKAEGDFTFLFKNSASFLKGADVLFCNLESVISDKGVKVGTIYSFRAEPEAMEALEFAGFNVVSVANNHVFDYGRSAMEDSFRRLRGSDIKVVGGGFSESEACSPQFLETKGVKIAFLGYTEFAARWWVAGEDRSGVCFLDGGIKNKIEEAAKKADVVVVSMHFGDEYQETPNPEQKRIARSAIDSGADLVIGHHPHVAQPVEEYNGGFIAYSLGNFIFDQSFSEETMTGQLIEADVGKKGVLSVTPRTVKLNEFFQPEIIPEF